MTYGRARLWLGITGVGSLVTIAFVALVTGLPSVQFQTEPGFSVRALFQLMGVTGLFMLWLVPLDFLGGFALPRKYGKSDQAFGDWLKQYIPAALLQACLFILFGSLIILTGQTFGRLGAILLLCVLTIACLTFRNRAVLRRQLSGSASSEKLLDAIVMIQSWQIYVPQTVVVKHKDIGFTGGVVGLGKNTKIVIPEAWLSFDQDQLATAIARRAYAVSSGSYVRGMVVAFMWNLIGFFLCSFLPGAGLVSIAGFVTTLCGFTLWSFLGLLLLPTVSRNASLKIDQSLVQRGMPVELISNTASSVDQLQDDEPERAPIIETIFHPVPSVVRRNQLEPVRGFAAWNVARTTLFFSWACLGFLSRSVHCNVGRPELWTMLPTD